jgi:hypothetical protein
MPPIVKTSCKVVEPEKVGTKIPAKLKPGQIVPMGQIGYEYSFTEYSVESWKMLKANIGPVINDKYIISVAKGCVKEYYADVENSATADVGASVGADLKGVLNMALTGNESGTVRASWKYSKTYVGPPEGSRYITRTYYGAMNFDLCQAMVECIDHYDEYSYSNGHKYLRARDVDTRTYYKTLDKYKKPHGYEHCVDN